MSGSPSTEIGDLQEVGPSISDPYDDDLSEDSVLITPFEISTSTFGKLAGGSSEDESIDPNSTCDEEGETYAEIISHARVRAALKRPIRLCKFYGVPTCLMVLEIELLETRHTRQMPRLLRFKAVDVAVEFKDAAGVSRLGPEILMFCLEICTGKPTVITHSYSTTVGASLDVSNALPAGPSIGLHRTHASHFAETANQALQVVLFAWAAGRRL